MLISMVQSKSKKHYRMGLCIPEEYFIIYIALVKYFKSPSKILKKIKQPVINLKALQKMLYTIYCDIPHLSKST